MGFAGVLVIAAGISAGKRQSVPNLIEPIAETQWTSISHWMEGSAEVAETAYIPFQHDPDSVPVRLIVRRVKPTPGSQPALSVNCSYHAFITDREANTLDLEADHRRHAEIENAIRDPASSAVKPMKYSMALNHLPSGRFPANAARLAVKSVPSTRYRVIAHHTPRWITRTGLGGPVTTTMTLRRRFYSFDKSRKASTHHPPTDSALGVENLARGPGDEASPDRGLETKEFGNAYVHHHVRWRLNNDRRMTAWRPSHSGQLRCLSSPPFRSRRIANCIFRVFASATQLSTSKLTSARS